MSRLSTPITPDGLTPAAHDAMICRAPQLSRNGLFADVADLRWIHCRQWAELLP